MDPELKSLKHRLRQLAGKWDHRLLNLQAILQEMHEPGKQSMTVAHTMGQAEVLQDAIQGLRDTILRCELDFSTSSESGGSSTSTSTKSPSATRASSSAAAPTGVPPSPTP